MILLKKIFIIIFLTIYFNASAEDQNTPSEILFIKNDFITTPSLFYTDILELGYDADVVKPDSATLDLMLQHKLTVLSAGNYAYACGNSEMRLALQTYILEYNGKVLIEGGHTGYIAAVYPFYLGFRNKVIMIEDWIADNGGSLTLSFLHSQSSLANNPEKLPQSIQINYSSVTDQDVCTNTKFSELFYGTSLYNNKVGVLAAPTVDNPRVINFFFYYEAVANHVEGKKLLRNSIYNLIGNPVSVNYNGQNIPAKFNLHQNFPNPFNPGTKINYELPITNYVSIKIHDVSGKEISTLINERQNAGSYEIDFNGTDYPSGIYFYTLYIDGNYFDSKKNAAC